ncbi:MAG: methionine--tRNA ligase, partial [Candidatus Levybacteria bacterium]|nr:methionine--tRNA ligase [Candidatus Levybacteria bacterium]
MKSTITKEQFDAIDLRVGMVIKAERKEDADKLIRLTVDFGEEGTRNILTSLFPIYQPDDLANKKFIFIIN